VHSLLDRSEIGDWLPTGAIGSRLKSRVFQPGTDVMIFKIFSPQNSAKKLAFLSQNKAKF
jgi:hypothetical protein